MNKKANKYLLKFPLIYGLLFSLIGIVIGIYISQIGGSEDYKYFYVYASISGFITAWVVSYLINQRKNRFSNVHLFLTSIIVGLLSHWLCWYFIAIELNIRFWIFDEHFFEPPLNLFESLFGVFAFCLWSWMFFGWATVIGSISTIYIAKYINLKIIKK